MQATETWKRKSAVDLDLPVKTEQLDPLFFRDYQTTENLKRKYADDLEFGAKQQRMDSNYLQSSPSMGINEDAYDFPVLPPEVDMLDRNLPAAPVDVPNKMAIVPYKPCMPEVFGIKPIPRAPPSKRLDNRIFTTVRQMKEGASAMRQGKADSTENKRRWSRSRMRELGMNTPLRSCIKLRLRIVEVIHGNLKITRARKTGKIAEVTSDPTTSTLPVQNKEDNIHPSRLLDELPLENQSNNVPSNLEETNIDRDKRRARERFFDAERKYILARKKFERNCKARAIQMYHKQSELLVGVDQNCFVDAYVAKELAKYDSAKDEKMKQIVERINMGYEKFRRGARVNSRRPMERKNEITTHPMSDSPILIAKQSQEKLEVKGKVNHHRSNVCIANSVRFGSRSQGGIEISYGKVFKCKFIQQGLTLDRYEVVCRRLNMSFTMKPTDVNALEIEGLMASTLHFNLLSIWMEHNIPIVTSQDFWIVNNMHDGMHHQVFSQIPPYPKLLFIPVLYMNHWTLYTVVNFVGHNLSCLGGRRGIMYMDPMGRPPVEEIVANVLDGVRIVWDQWYRVDEIPTGPIKVFPCPMQPNATDCGFYVMQCIQTLYEEILSGTGGARVCESNILFNNEDVLHLRRVLAHWARKLMKA